LKKRMSPMPEGGETAWAQDRRPKTSDLWSQYTHDNCMAQATHGDVFSEISQKNRSEYPPG
jgi:hypothetical protein